MAQDNPAEWAMAKAQEVQDAILSMNPVTRSEYAASRVLIIASAIEAADRAATERERERCAKIAEEYRVWPSSFTHSDVARAIAAAIRKGGDND